MTSYIEKIKSLRVSSDDITFYILILLACFSPPLVEYGGDYLTLFDVYLLVYGVFKLVKDGLCLKNTHWVHLFIVVSVYLIFLTIGFLRVFEIFSLLLLVKNFEHLLFLFLLADKFERSENPLDLVYGILVILFSVVLYQIGYYHGILEGIGKTHRLGLPFMEGTSSNPAGFFLAALLLFVYHQGLRIKEIRKIGVCIALLAGYALVLTVSRTNMLALGFVIAVSLLVKAWKSRFRWPLFLFFIVFVIFFFTFGLNYLPHSGSIGKVVKILENPLSIMEDSSFQTRITRLWPLGFLGWMESLFTLFFGQGVGHFIVIDGTVPRILGELGMIGFFLFFYIWFVHYVIYYPFKAVFMLLLFSFINGINADTLIVSYRSVQLYIIILIITLYMSKFIGNRVLQGQIR